MARLLVAWKGFPSGGRRSETPGLHLARDGRGGLSCKAARIPSILDPLAEGIANDPGQGILRPSTVDPATAAILPSSPVEHVVHVGKVFR